MQQAGSADPGPWVVGSSVLSHRENAGHLVSSPIVILLFSELEQYKQKTLFCALVHPIIPSCLAPEKRHLFPWFIGSQGDAFASVVGGWNLLWSAALDVGLHPADPTRPRCGWAAEGRRGPWCRWLGPPGSLPVEEWREVCESSWDEETYHPYAPCMVCLPTSGWFLRQILVDVPYMEHMGHHNHQGDVE